MANNQIAEAPALAPEPNQINQDQGEIPEIRTVPGGLTMGMIANTVESFSGKENVREYFEKIELRARLDNWDRQITVDIIRYRLSGEAYRFLKSDLHLESHDISYEELKEKFMKRLSPITVPGESLIKLTRCYQRHDETVSNFVSRLKILGAEILREDLENSLAYEDAGIKRKCKELVLHQFKSGLKRDLIRNLGPLLMRTQNLSIEQAEEFARQEELNQIMLQNRQPSHLVGTVTCFKCGRPNHYANRCRYNANQTQFRPNQRPPNQHFRNESRRPDSYPNQNNQVNSQAHFTQNRNSNPQYRPRNVENRSSEGNEQHNYRDFNDRNLDRRPSSQNPRTTTYNRNSSNSAFNRSLNLQSPSIAPRTEGN